jgi:7-carboxy-7-deazaguanine synthase
MMMGVPTFFIRTSGCNLDCSWCDTKYAFSEEGEDHDVSVLAELVDVSHVCITGGEPMLQKDLPRLIDLLLAKGKHIVLETNGSIDITGLNDNKNLMISMDIKCPSSKMSDRMLMSNISHLKEKDQLKFIIKDNEDLDYAIQIMDEYFPHTNIILSPVGGMNIVLLAEEVLVRKLDVRVLPQLHKIIWGEKRSV